MTASPRRLQIEEMLKDDPTDEFLRYGLAMEHASEGDHAEAARLLVDLIAGNPAKPYVPAYLMAAQSLVKVGRTPDALPILRDGVAAAQKQGNLHAAGELQGMLDTLE